MTFVTLEGIDGSSKTTVLNKLEEEYDTIVTTSEPTTFWTGQKLRQVLQDESSPEFLDFYLFLADRIKHINTIIEPVDERGDLVVSERYMDSTRAYQPVAMVEADLFDSQWEAKNFIEQCVRPWHKEPDKKIYLDVSIETALSRMEGDEKYESKEFLESVQKNYHALVTEHDNFHRVDAEQDISNVVEDVIEVIEQ